MAITYGKGAGDAKYVDGMVEGVVGIWRRLAHGFGVRVRLIWVLARV
jgi:hypothetical protein